MARGRGWRAVDRRAAAARGARTRDGGEGRPGAAAAAVGAAAAALCGVSVAAPRSCAVQPRQPRGSCGGGVRSGPARRACRGIGGVRRWGTVQGSWACRGLRGGQGSAGLCWASTVMGGKEPLRAPWVAGTLEAGGGGTLCSCCKRAAVLGEALRLGAGMGLPQATLAPPEPL